MLTNLFTLTGIPVAEVAARLAAPFDAKAYKGVPGGADLTDISTGYMIERATEVFGLRSLGWKLEYSSEHMTFIGLGEGKRVTAHLKYAVFSYALASVQGEIGWYPIVTSGLSNNDFPYAEEGARTAAIGAALKSLCFQLPVYKGLLDHHNAAKTAGNTPSNGSKSTKPAGENPLKAPAAYQAPAKPNGKTTLAVPTAPAATAALEASVLETSVLEAGVDELDAPATPNWGGYVVPETANGAKLIAAVAGKRLAEISNPGWIAWVLKQPAKDAAMTALQEAVRGFQGQG